MGCQESRMKRSEAGTKKTKLHELLHTEIVNHGTLRLASGICDVPNQLCGAARLVVITVRIADDRWLCCC